MTPVRVRPLILTVVIAAIFAVVIDRVALAVWESRVKTLHGRLAQDANKFYFAPGGSVGWIPKAGNDPWPRLIVSFESTGIRPDGIIDDSEKGLQLVFLPPLVAWSTRLWPRLGFDRTPIPPVMSHRYVIRISRPVDQKASVELSKGIFTP